MLLGYAHRLKVLERITAKEVLSRIYRVYRFGRLPEPEGSEIDRLDDCLYLASKGYWGTLESVSREVIEFLGKYADYEPDESLIPIK